MGIPGGPSSPRDYPCSRQYQGTNVQNSSKTQIIISIFDIFIIIEQRGLIMARKRLGSAIEKLIKTQKNGTKKIESYTLYKDMVTNALDDGVITKNEKSVLTRMGKNLGLSKEEQDVIIKDVQKDFVNKKKRAAKRKEQQKKGAKKDDPKELKKQVTQLTKENKALDKENKKLTRSIKKLESENKKLKKTGLEPIQELEPLESLGKAEEVVSDKKVFKTKPKGLEKDVICPHCNKEIIVEVLKDQPTIVTCEHCNERSYTE
jgi:hypothetical protein